MDSILDGIQKWIEYHKWDLVKNKTLLAVSGGRDSMTLLEFFRRQNFPIEVAHVNYNFRKESHQETELVKKYCSEKNIPFHCLDVDGNKEIQENKRNLQDWARELRYRFFDDFAKKSKAKYIATAHHLDDNVETFFMRLFQSSGLQGLSGIPAQRGKYIRPFLTLGSEEVEELQKEWKVPFAQDMSNFKTNYKRNEIRHNLGPFLKKNYPGSYPNIGESIFYLSESLEFYNIQKNRQIKKLIRPNKNYSRVSIDALMAAPNTKTLIYELFREFGFESSQTGEIIKLAHSITGSSMSSASHRIIKDRSDLLISDLSGNNTSPIISIEKGQRTYEDKRLAIALKNLDMRASLKNSPMEIFIAEEKLEYPLIVRPWKKGDYFYPEGLNKKKKLSDFFGDHKLNLIEKENVDVLQSGDKIVAVLGYRMDHRFLAKVNKPSLRLRYKLK